MALKSRIIFATLLVTLLVATTLVVAGRASLYEVEQRFNDAAVTGKTVLWRKIVSNQLNNMEASVTSITIQT